ncbi:MAG: AraC family transcriptional regulator [Melioribacteraceae bacterium]|nr:AraC family transcriptional regulator [Melioribacteraceae bacterium]MCF8265045.1 AraC family transcriptional regulator [Melioribacteraceae bacterium]MCF8414392.1 AraC family transcriptional regulator [Melioribacteraceae bacterium]MCF8430964.1 AraC family transcriptional regulator [Melioribacteraceae bacterium]
MILRTHRPSFPLDQFIENFVYHSGFTSPHSKDRMFPDGSVYMVIDLTESPKNVYENSTLKVLESYKYGWLSGVKKDYLTFDSANNSDMFVVQFKPGGTVPFFDFPINEVSGKVVQADLILGNGFLSFREQLLEADSPTKKFIVADNFFKSLSKTFTEPDPSIRFALDQLTSDSCNLTIAEIRQKIGYSHKHFIHLFEKQVGLTPKYFSRIIKFQKVLVEIGNKKNLNWSNLALELGYYDQAHFINDFKKFSGINPTTYIQEKGEFINYIPID